MSLVDGLAVALLGGRARLRRGPASNADYQRRATWYDMVSSHDGALTSSYNTPGPHTNSDADKATWYDQSLGARHGTLTNFGFTTSSGWAGSGTSADPYRLVFDGTNDYVAVPTLNACDDKAFTYEAWYMRSGAPSVTGDLIAEGNAADANTYPRAELAIYTDGRVRFLTCGTTGVPVNVYSPASVCDGAWHHIVATADGTYARLYVDGLLVAGPTALLSGSLGPTGWMTIGALRANSTPGFWYYLSGSLAVARIYDRTLSDAEVAASKALGPAGTGYPTSQLLLDLNAARATQLSGWFGDGTAVNPYALVCDGTTTKVDCGSSAWMAGITGLTVHAVFRRGAVDASSEDWIGGTYAWNSDVQLRGGFRIGWLTGATYPTCTIVLVDSGGTQYEYSASTAGIWNAPLGEWHTYTMTWDDASATLKLYVDGALKKTVSTGGSGKTLATAHAQPLRWGCEGYTYGYLLGAIASGLLWTRALSDGEVAELAAGGANWVPPVPDDMLTGRLQVQIGSTPLDVTSALRRDLSWGHVAPGGFGAAHLQLPATTHDAPYAADVARGAAVAIKYSEAGTQTTLWEGIISADPSRPTLSNGELYYEVECAGDMALLSQRDDYVRTWVDDDLTQWQLSPSADGAYDTDTDGRLAIIARKGQPYRGGRGAAFYYWLDGGLSGDSIDHISLRLGNYSGGNGMDLAISGNFHVSVTYATSPWGTRSTAQQWDPSASQPVAAGTTYRVPATGSFPAGTTAVWLYLYTDSDATPTADRYVCVDQAIVYRTSDAVRIDQAMTDIVSGIASSTDIAPLGNARTDIAARGPMTRADALDQLVALHNEPVFYWWDAGRVFRERTFSYLYSDPYLTIDPTQPGIDVDLQLDPEGAPQYCRVIYVSSGPTSDYPGSSVPAGYVDSFVVDVNGFVSTPGPTDRVATLDLRDAGRTYSCYEADVVAQLYLQRWGNSAVSGTVTLHVTEVATSDGKTVLPHTVTAGTYCLVQGYTAQRVLITAVEFSADDGALTLTLGTERGEWRLPTPYPSAIGRIRNIRPARRGPR